MREGGREGGREGRKERERLSMHVHAHFTDAANESVFDHCGDLLY